MLQFLAAETLATHDTIATIAGTVSTTRCERLLLENRLGGEGPQNWDGDAGGWTIMLQPPAEGLPISDWALYWAATRAVLDSARLLLCDRSYEPQVTQGLCAFFGTHMAWMNKLLIASASETQVPLREVYWADHQNAREATSGADFAVVISVGENLYRLALIQAKKITSSKATIDLAQTKALAPGNGYFLFYESFEDKLISPWIVPSQWIKHPNELAKDQKTFSTTPPKDRSLDFPTFLALFMTSPKPEGEAAGGVLNAQQVGERLALACAHGAQPAGLLAVMSRPEWMNLLPHLNAAKLNERRASVVDGRARQLASQLEQTLQQAAPPQPTYKPRGLGR